MLLFQPEILVFAVQRNKIILNDRFSLSEAGYTQLSSFIVWIQVTENNPSFFNDTYRHKNKTGAKAPVFCLRINQILKEEPQPQVVLAFGLVTINREPSSPSV